MLAADTPFAIVAGSLPHTGTQQTALCPANAGIHDHVVSWSHIASHVGGLRRRASRLLQLELELVDSDAKCNPVDSIGSSTKSRVSHSERRPSARFPGDKDGSARRNIEPLQ